MWLQFFHFHSPETGKFIQDHIQKLLHQRAFRANCQPNSHFARLGGPNWKIEKLKMQQQRKINYINWHSVIKSDALKIAICFV